MMRKSVAAMLCLGVLALSANTAQATGGSSFAKCLRTPLAHFPGTIADAAAQTEDLSILYDLVVKAGLGGALSDPNAELTVYAPTNAAFLAIPELIRNAIVADDDALTALIAGFGGFLGRKGDGHPGPKSPSVIKLNNLVRSSSSTHHGTRCG